MWDVLIAALVVIAAVFVLPVWARHRTRRLERLENARRNRVCSDWMKESAER